MNTRNDLHFPRAFNEEVLRKGNSIQSIWEERQRIQQRRRDKAALVLLLGCIVMYLTLSMV